MRETQDMEAMWVCRLAYNDGMPISSKMGCFTDEMSGRAWIAKESSLPKGQILKANCMHRGQMMMNWMKDPMP